MRSRAFSSNEYKGSKQNFFKVKVFSKPILLKERSVLLCPNALFISHAVDNKGTENLLCTFIVRINL